jgi:hypothetical protein
MHETNLLESAKGEIKHYRGDVKIIYVVPGKLKIDQDGDIIFQRKGTSYQETLNARTIIGADGRKSIVNNCIPDNDFIHCRDHCKIKSKDEIKGHRFGSVYIIPKTKHMELNHKKYINNFKITNTMEGGFQNRYRIFNTTDKFIYLAFQWYDSEVQKTGPTYELKQESVPIILKYIKFLTGMEQTSVMEELVNNGMEAFEITPGFRKRFFYSNKDQVTDYLLIGDSAVGVDFFSGHGLENADKIIDSFLDELENDFVLGTTEQVFHLETEKIKVYNCLKHLSSILRRPVRFDSKNSFIKLLDEYYGVIDQDRKYLMEALGYDELRILFNPRHDKTLNPIQFHMRRVKNRQCTDIPSTGLRNADNHKKTRMKSILNKIAETKAGQIYTNPNQ